ncbi:MAG: DUF2520 domain-containing protein [Frankiaceae bacterium]
MTQRTAVPPVGLVGAGRAGTALAAALRGAGVELTGVLARSELSRRRAGDALPGVPVLGPGALPELTGRAGLVLLAVPDDALPELAGRLARRPGQVVVHTSGRYGVAVLGAPGGRAAAHPCMTFPGAPDDAARVAGTTFGVTADDDARPVVEALVAAVGGRVELVAEELRPLYHAALANAANHLVALVAQSADWLRAAGVAAAPDALAPLVTAALAGALDRGDAALTGPVARGDAGTVEAHLAALRAAGAPPAAVAAYVAMAALTAERARAAGLLDDDRMAALRAVLARVT